MFERVRLQLRVRPSPALTVPRTMALVLYQQPATGAVPPPPQAPATNAAANPINVDYIRWQRSPCSAALKLDCRPTEPHEYADRCYIYGLADLCEDGVDSFFEQLPHGDVHLTLADGSTLKCSAFQLACNSLMLRTLLTSSGFREAVDADDGTQRSAWQVSMATHDPAAVRGTVAWILADNGPAKREAAARLLTPDLVVAVASLAHYLGIEPLVDAATRTLSAALDERNAPSVLLLARSLGHKSLEKEATLFILSELDAVLDADETYWLDLPAHTREMLRALRAATVRNPLLNASGVAYNPFAVAGGGVSDARELLGIVRESLAELRDRFDEATRRQALEPWDAEEPPSSAGGKRQRLAVDALERQSSRIRSLEEYLLREEEAFAAILSSPLDAEHQWDAASPSAHSETAMIGSPARREATGSLAAQQGLTSSSASASAASSSAGCGGTSAASAAAASTPSGSRMKQGRLAASATPPRSMCRGVTAAEAAAPTYEWQLVPEEVMAVPPGLDLDLPLDGVSPRRYRIPPRWPLKVWIDDDLGFWRTDVRAQTSIGELRQAAALFASRQWGGSTIREVCSPSQVALRFKGRGGAEEAPLEDALTAESVDLFNRRLELSCSIKRLQRGELGGTPPTGPRGSSSSPPFVETGGLIIHPDSANALGEVKLTR